MTAPANAARGETSLTIADETLRLRPSFTALVAAEAELGPLFALVERAAAGGLTLAELAALMWHCAEQVPAGMDRAVFSDGLVAGGLATVTPALRVLLGQILAGR